MILGAIEAAKEAARAYPVCGLRRVEDAVNAVARGDLLATIAQPQEWGDSASSRRSNI